MSPSLPGKAERRRQERLYIEENTIGVENARR
jgi:hypothetical protein